MVLPAVLPRAAPGNVGSDDRSSEGRLKPCFGAAFAALAPLVIGSAASSTRVDVATLVVRSGESAVEALSRAASGDILRLAAGTYSGDLVTDRPGIALEGEPGAVVLGTRKGNAITIRAPDVAVRKLTIRGSVVSLIDKDSGVFVGRGGEAERGTLPLLLVYLAHRWQIVIGRFLGHLRILTLATFIGYGVAGLALVLVAGGDGDALAAFAPMAAASALLGGVFIALGYFISALVRDRGAAGGIGIGVWLLLVLLYDMALLGALSPVRAGHSRPAPSMYCCCSAPPTFIACST
jgi:hypothetical protein